MSDNLIEKDGKVRERNRKIFRVLFIIGAIVTGIANLIFLAMGDLTFGSVASFLFCILMIVLTKKGNIGGI